MTARLLTPFGLDTQELTRLRQMFDDPATKPRARMFLHYWREYGIAHWVGDPLEDPLPVVELESIANGPPRLWRRSIPEPVGSHSVEHWERDHPLSIIRPSLVLWNPQSVFDFLRDAIRSHEKCTLIDPHALSGSERLRSATERLLDSGASSIEIWTRYNEESRGGDARLRRSSEPPRPEDLVERFLRKTFTPLFPGGVEFTRTRESGASEAWRLRGDRLEKSVSVVILIFLTKFHDRFLLFESGHFSDWRTAVSIGFGIQLLYENKSIPSCVARVSPGDVDDIRAYIRHRQAS